MSEEESGLPAILKYKGMAEHFKEQEYASEFKENLYMMSPVLFHNIYKGALGEVAGKFILENERKIMLNPITEPDKFEFFDYEMKPSIYVDFKNWKFTYLKDKEEIHKEIIRKLDAIDGKRAYIINVIGSEEFDCHTSYDGRIVEISGLIDKNGNVIKRSLDYIKTEDYE